MNSKDAFILILSLAFLESCSLNSSIQPSGSGSQTPAQKREAARRAIAGATTQSRQGNTTNQRSWLSKKGKGFNLFNRSKKTELGHNTPNKFVSNHPHPHNAEKTVQIPADELPQKTKTQPRRTRVKYMKRDLDSGMSTGLKPASSRSRAGTSTSAYSQGGSTHSHGGSTHSHGGSTHSHGGTALKSAPTQQSANQSVARIKRTPVSRGASEANKAGVSGIQVNEQTPALSIEEINRLIDANTFSTQ